MPGTITWPLETEEGGRKVITDATREEVAPEMQSVHLSILVLITEKGAWEPSSLQNLEMAFR